MGPQQPFLYENLRDSKPFDPKAVTRASFQTKPQRPKQEGPLISFNQHPDSYMIVPFGNSTTQPMKASTKKWIKWLRIMQLALRVLELVGALGMLVLMILLRGMESSTGWIMRVAPAVAVLHTVYAVYHLSRKASGRTPASSASYMLFASFFDVSLVPCYAFSALVAKTKQDGWKTVLTDQSLTTTFSKSVFYIAMVAGGLHLVTLGLSINLAITFRRITMLPPDMNPLEDNLTSRHKRNKSSMSTMTTNSDFSKRASTISENKRASANAYEDLSRPPTIPFFHTRVQSTDSFSTYKSTPPPSRDARSELPSRQQGPAMSNSPRSSIVSNKRTSYYDMASVPRHNESYTELPFTDAQSTPPKHSRQESNMQSQKSSRQMGNMTEAWFTSDSLSNSPRRSTIQKPTHGGGQYQPVSQPYDDDISTFSYPNKSSNNSPGSSPNQRPKQAFSHPNPVGANPPTPRRPNFPRGSTVSVNSPLSEISTNRRSLSFTKSTEGGDIADNYMSAHRDVHAKKYDFSDEEDNAPVVIKEKESFKAKYYGELKPGTPPVMVGVNGVSGRQVSSGTDFGKRREVSGKVAEEGRSNAAAAVWGTRLRKVSGMLM